MNQILKCIYLNNIYYKTLFSNENTNGIYYNIGLSKSKLPYDLSIYQKFLFYVILILESLSNISYSNFITYFLEGIKFRSQLIK